MNEAPTSPFGAMLRVQASWSDWLDLDLLIRMVASAYRDQLKALHLDPGPADVTVARGVEVELTPLEAPLPPWRR